MSGDRTIYGERGGKCIHLTRFTCGTCAAIACFDCGVKTTDDDEDDEIVLKTPGAVDCVICEPARWIKKTTLHGGDE